ATLSTTLLGPGPRTLRAYYQGSGTLAAGSSAPVSTTIGVRTQNGFASAVGYTAGANLRAVAVGDFNHDGIQDIAAGGTSTAAVSILLGAGDGTFTNIGTYSTGAPPQAIAVGDFNGDGNQDLAIATSGNNSVTILLGTGSGTFGGPATYSVGS